MTERNENAIPQPTSFVDKVIYFCMRQKIVVVIFVLAIVAGGVYVAPFDWDVGIDRQPIGVDAIPDIGENQQIIFTTWMGRSPQDVEDQITYPLTVALLGIPEVKTIRSFSSFGFSSIYVIFNEGAEFYWSRSRLLEKLNSLPAGTIPDGVQPTLGPDATALGQIYWYTLEGHDLEGNPIGGFELHELRSIQDWNVRYALASADGISEVASIGGFVQEYQVDVDPDAMRANGVSLADVFQAVRMSNIDVGARTIEINRAEYVIRGLGFIKEPSDLEKVVLRVIDEVPITIKDVASVALGPALRRGVLDKGGAEAVGGVAVVRYGYNPLQAIKNVKKKIKEIEKGLPTHVLIDFNQVARNEVETYANSNRFEAFIGTKLNHADWEKHLRGTERENWPAWANLSQVAVVPFYDRTELIHETLGTLNEALIEELLVTIIVILVSVMHFRSSLLISLILPLTVLLCFIGMSIFHVEANIVALSGIAIAIGTVVDMGIILCENILKHLDEAPPEEDRFTVIYRASREVAGPLTTALSTTVISFLPVFVMVGAEGKLFRPLAFTKTLALIASLIIAIIVIPPAAHVLFTDRVKSGTLKKIMLWALVVAGILVGFFLFWWAGTIIAALGLFKLAEERLPKWSRKIAPFAVSIVAIMIIGVFLTEHWMPLGPEQGMPKNLILVGGLIGGLLLFFQIFQRFLYAPILRWCLSHKVIFLCLPISVLLVGLCVWQGFDRVFSFVPAIANQSAVTNQNGIAESQVTLNDSPTGIRGSNLWQFLSDTFPGLGKEFMPPLDEGSFLYMPTTMPHASIGEATDVLQLQNKMISSIPEIETVVGKIGRADSPLDPAPISMIETMITYKSEYITDKNGHRVNFRFNDATGEFERKASGALIPDQDGKPYRQWRDDIRTPDDIWKEIVAAAEIPGTTSAPKLQPIAARIVMLQSGMRAPMGLKIKGPSLESIENVAYEIERLLKEVPSVNASAVIADRIVGKPYLEIDIDRDAIKRYGLHIRKVQDVIEVAVGGRRVTTTIEGRERYPVRVRYPRELRDRSESLGRILVPTPTGAQIPLEQLAEIRFVRGPQVIKSEDTFLVGYVLFDMNSGNAEVDVVEDCRQYLEQKINGGELVLPSGVSYTFAGNYENQVRAQKTLMIVLPLALVAIFLNLYFEFRSVITTSLVFSGVIIAWAGGFIMVWLYGQSWFMDFELFETNMRTLFQIHPINLSVAVWVGFLALFGIADDDGVVIASYLDRSFKSRPITNYQDAREATLAAGQRRVRACLMTTATTILSLIPVLTSTGRGADIMVPMAIPAFGGMLIAVMTMFVVPVLYCSVMEWKLKLGIPDARFDETTAP